jgi:hypothetical protein
MVPFSKRDQALNPPSHLFKLEKATTALNGFFRVGTSQLAQMFSLFARLVVPKSFASKRKPKSQADIPKPVLSPLCKSCKALLKKYPLTENFGIIHLARRITIKKHTASGCSLCSLLVLMLEPLKSGFLSTLEHVAYNKYNWGPGLFVGPLGIGFQFDRDFLPRRSPSECQSVLSCSPF